MSAVIVRLALGQTGDVSRNPARPLRLDPGALRFTYRIRLCWAHSKHPVGTVFSVLPPAEPGGQCRWLAAVILPQLWRHTDAELNDLQVSPTFWAAHPGGQPVGVGPTTIASEMSLCEAASFPRTTVQLLPRSTVELGRDGIARHPLRDAAGQPFLSVCRGLACRHCAAIDRGAEPEPDAAQLARLAAADAGFAAMRRAPVTMPGGSIRLAS